MSEVVLEAPAPMQSGLARYPYPGLRPYEFHEASIFFGRDSQIDELLERLAEYRFLAVIGTSGCGKSSLVRAGLMPALESGLLPQAGFDWRVAAMRPGHQPMRRLARALLESGVLGEQWPDTPEDEMFLLTTLRQGPLSLVELLEKRDRDSAGSLLLLVDQFEEIFRYARHGDQDEAVALVELLLACSKCDDSGIYVVITLRSDFLGQCPIFRGLPEAMNQSQFLTPRLSRKQIKEAIERPASLFGTTVNPKVVGKILNGMGSDPDQLPLMQHLLMRMWRRAARAAGVPLEEIDDGKVSSFEYWSHQDAPDLEMTVEDYYVLDGLTGALSGHVNEIFNRLGSDDERGIAKTIFRCLTEITPDGQMVRRAAAFSEILESAADKRARVTHVMDEFRLEGRSFLVPPKKDGLTDETLVDISHESLIRQWDALRQWTEEEHDMRKVRQFVEENAAIWNEDWRGQEREEDVLCVGMKLSEALEWRQRRPGEVSEVCSAFLDASVSLRERQERQEEAARHAEQLGEKNKELEYASLELKRRNQDLLDAENKQRSTNRWLRRFIGLTILMLGIAVFMAGRALYQRQKAEEAKQEAEDLQVRAEEKSLASQVRGLVAEGSTMGAANPERQLILAAEALQIEDRLKRQSNGRSSVPAVSTFFQSALANFQAGGMQSAVIGRCGTLATAFATVESEVEAGSDTGAVIWVLVGGEDQEARLWGLRKGDLQGQSHYHLRGELGRITAVAFGGLKWIAMGNDEGMVFLWHFNQQQPALAHAARINREKTAISDLEFSKNPDGPKWLVASASDGKVDVWNLEGGNLDLKGSVQHEKGVTDIAITDDGQTLITGSHDKTARSWDLESDPVRELAVYNGNATSSIVDVAKVAGGGVATASRDNNVRLWDNPDKPPILLGAGKALVSLSVSKDGNRVLAGDSRGSIHFWDLRRFRETGSKPSRLGWSLGEDPVRNVTFSPDGAWMAGGSSEQHLALWRLTDAGPQRKPLNLRGHRGEERRGLVDHGTSFLLKARFVQVDQITRWLITLGHDGVLRKWDLRQYNDVIHNAATDHFAQTAVYPGGKWLVTKASQMKGNEVVGYHLHAWSWGDDTPNGVMIRQSNSRDLDFMSLLPGGEWILGRDLPNDEDERNLTWLLHINSKAVGGGRRLGSLPLTKQQQWLTTETAPDVTAIAHSRDQTALAAEDGKIYFSKHTEMATTTLQASDDLNQVPVSRLKLSPNGEWLAAWRPPGKLELWHPSGAENERLQRTLQPVTSFAMNDDWIAIARPDRPIRLERLGAPPGEDGIQIFNENESLEYLRLSLDSRWLLAGSREGDLTLWSIESTNVITDPVLVLPGYGSGEHHAAFDANSEWFVVGTEKGAIRAWHLQDIRSGETGFSNPIVSFVGHDKPLVGLHIDDSDSIYSVSQDGTARRWQLGSEPSLETRMRSAAQVVGRNMTHGEWQRERKLTESSFLTFPKEYLQVYPPPAFAIHSSHLDWASRGARYGEAHSEFEASRKELVKLLVADYQASPNVDRDTNEEAQLMAMHLTHLEYGREMARRGKVEDAKTSFEKAATFEALSFEPQAEAERLAARYFLSEGDAVAVKGDRESAIALYEKAFLYDPNLKTSDAAERAQQLAAASYRAEAERYAAAGRIEESVKAFEKAAQLVPAPPANGEVPWKNRANKIYVNALVQQSQASLWNDDLSQAIDQSKELVRKLHSVSAGEELSKEEVDKRVATSIVQKARAEVTLGNFSMAQDLYNDLRQRGQLPMVAEQEGEWLFKRYQYHLKSGETDAAQQCLELAGSLGVTLSRFYVNVMRRDAARKDYEEGRRAARSGNWELAAKNFEEAQEKDGSLKFDATGLAKLLASKYYRDLAENAGRGGHLDSAQAYLKQVKELDPEQSFDAGLATGLFAIAPQTTDKLLLQYGQAEDFNEALNLFQEARRVKPSVLSDGVLDELCRRACVSKDFLADAKIVKPVIDYLIQLDPFESRFRLTRGLVALRLKTPEIAREEFNRYLAWSASEEDQHRQRIVRTWLQHAADGKPVPISPVDWRTLAQIQSKRRSSL